MSEVKITRDGHVASVELQRGPNNFVDISLINDIATAYEELDADTSVRAIVLCSDGKHFSAGANLAERVKDDGDSITQEATRHLYQEAHRLMSNRKPVVAAVRGAAVGAGIGLALSADFRVGSAETRLSANFCRQGYHPGFGTTYTLPRIVGDQQAAWLFYTGRRVPGDEAYEMGLLDWLVESDQIRAKAHEVAAEIAVSAPLAVEFTRKTLRNGVVDAFKLATYNEAFEQNLLNQTHDFKEGVKAMNERRVPDFKGY
ncbi:enoyl-CoA hydratase/isomerase family protein [Pseudooceanicola sp.]|uniref:enoyl-CoA hydratase/isomerase family protein n=1 Tax=Pseudooceanicola sp. TaxID=1914328 RepID=UPI002619C226|nr:enoyl-CoA hydratase/isomerase family protein [Pseudooceanicola sp.]MDF1856440.1 enoyl-CoA hydratase/isomerase family protein [Pseudooceanicola sp.]